MAVATGVLVVSGSVGGVRIDVANFQLTTSSAAMFWTGALAAIALAVGIGLLRGGLRRVRRSRRAARELSRGSTLDQSGVTAGSERIREA